MKHRYVRVSSQLTSLILLLGTWGCVTSETRFQKPCAQDVARQKFRSSELQAIVKADQEDRKNWLQMKAEQMAEMSRRDVARRERVGEIFGEGCLTTAEDYSAAALVFQHGDSPDHFYQVFIWAKRAIDLGDEKQKNLMALGLDRYLVNVGKKQLFASQARTEKLEGCYCLQQVERSFPEKRRREYTGRTLAEALKWVDSLNSGKTCPVAAECSEKLQPSPAGTLPGFW